MAKRKYKKRAPRPKTTTPVNAFDLKDVEPVINESLLISFKLEDEQHLDPLSFYESSYKRYITEVFSNRIISLIVTFIQTSSTIPKNLIQEKLLYKNILSIAKQLMMNEIEITLFTMYIDDLGWSFPGIHYLVHILFTALLTKHHCNKNIDHFMNYFQLQNECFIEKYTKWKEKINEDDYTNEEINERFTQINKPFNPYCVSDYIDYNCVVDSIITLSQPYGEQNSTSGIKEDKIIDLLKRKNETIQKVPEKNENIQNTVNSSQVLKPEVINHSIHSMHGVIPPQSENINGNHSNIATINEEASNLLEALSSMQRSNDASHSFNNDVLNLLYSNLSNHPMQNMNNINIINNTNNITIINNTLEHPLKSRNTISQKNTSFNKDPNLSFFGMFPPNQSFAISQQKFFDQTPLSNNQSSNLGVPNVSSVYNFDYMNFVNNKRNEKQ